MKARKHEAQEILTTWLAKWGKKINAAGRPKIPISALHDISEDAWAVVTLETRLLEGRSLKIYEWVLKEFGW